MLSGFALGALLGSVAAARLAFRATGLVMLAGAAVFGGCLLVIAVGVPVPVMIAAAFVAGAVNSNILVAYITMRTLFSPDALLGRVGATARTVSVGLTPIGALTAGALLDRIGGAATHRPDGGGPRDHRPAVRPRPHRAHGAHPGADPCRVAGERADARWEALRCAS